MALTRPRHEEWRARLQSLMREINAIVLDNITSVEAYEGFEEAIQEAIKEARRDWHARHAAALVEQARADVPPDVTDEEIERLTDELIEQVRSGRDAGNR